MLETLEKTESKQQEELSNTTDNKNYLIEFTDVENTPFKIVSQENEFFGIMGKHRITEKYEDKEQLEKELRAFDWNRLVQVMVILTEELNKDVLTELKEE